MLTRSLDGRVDAGIVYCSGRERYARILPNVNLVAFPQDFQVGPEDGLAVMKNARQEAMLLALMILSPAGQRILTGSSRSRYQTNIKDCKPARSVARLCCTSVAELTVLFRHLVVYGYHGPLTVSGPANLKVNDNGIWRLDLLHRLLDLPGRIGGGA